jgi:hypothetical protein
MNLNNTFNINNRDYYKEECTICLENLGNDDIAMLSCGHKYHHKCVLEWGNNSKTNCCICNNYYPLINIEKRKYFCCTII